MQNELSITELHETLSENISNFVFGHENTVKLLLGALLVQGHVILEGPPGIAKTLLAKCFASHLGLEFKRIQFTPDLMPSDITGVNVFDSNTASFHFSPGPLFADIILADEINRTPPKTQSALLEAMEERQITIDGECRSLSESFLVIATQNPIEYEGTFPLPEAQLDRFFYMIKLSYTEAAQEQKMYQELSKSNHLSESAISTPAIISLEQIQAARKKVRDVRISSSITKYIYSLISASREHSELILGASPRAGLALTLASKLNAAFSAREYTIPDDVQEAIKPVLRHRILLRPNARSLFSSTDELLDEIIDSIPVPAEIDD